MEAQSSSSQNAAPAKLKIAGAWTGVLDVDLHQWTLQFLRTEIANRSGCSPESVNLICAGKILRDVDGGKASLADIGLKNNAKILVTRVSVDEGKAIYDEAERRKRLARIRAAAEAMTKRHAAGTLPVEDFNLEIEDQSGKKVQLGSETEQRGVMMGLMLHANAKQLIRNQQYKDALDVLAMGEEAFSLCDPEVIKMVDNVPILQIDTVWCYFLLKDISRLSMAGVRLAKARDGLDRSHGSDSARVRLLQEGRHPELAIYLRLELLEGVVAYHSGLYEQSRKALTSAQAKYLQLQIPDEALFVLLSMGYKEKEAKRALRMTNQNVEIAVGFLIEEKEKEAIRHEEDLKERKEIMEQKKYGMTPLKKAINLQRLNELVSIGFEKSLAAEALRRNENDTQKALDDLTNPEINSKIQVYIDTKKRNRQRKAPDAAIEEFVSMGFERSQVLAAFQASETKEEALSLLVSNQVPKPPQNAGHIAASSLDANDTGVVYDGSHMDAKEESGPSGTRKSEDERDEDMENELVHKLPEDSISDYDIEVTVEGEAITQYLALLASTAVV